MKFASVILLLIVFIVPTDTSPMLKTKIANEGYHVRNIGNVRTSRVIGAPFKRIIENAMQSAKAVVPIWRSDPRRIIAL